MPSKYTNILVCALIIAVAIGYNPACSAAALAILFAYRIAEKYFHNTFFDQSRRELAQLRIDFTKVKEKQDKLDLKGAFGGKNG